MLKNICSMVFLCAVATACAKAPVGGADPGSGPSSGPDAVVAGSQQSDWAAIVRLEDGAKAIAKIPGCASSECRAAPVGSRACGGPRYYIPYCAKTTDSVTLYRKLDEVAKAERAYNAKYKLASTCEFRMPPLVEAIGGSCVAK
jgi:hypothetical protein